MVTDIINLTLQALLALGIYGALTLAYTALGAYANINVFKINESFDRKKWINGLAKYGVIALSVIVTLIGSYATITLAPLWGVEVANVQQISEQVIFAILVTGIATMVAQNIGKIAEIVGISKSKLEEIKKTALETPKGENLIINVDELNVQPDTGATDEGEAKEDK